MGSLIEKEEAVRDFLLELKDVMSKPIGALPSWVLVPRQENLGCLAELEWDNDDVAALIYSLSVEDYSSGPLKDRDEKGDVWIFGKKVFGAELYVKLKLASLGSLKRVRIISLHEADQPLSYPYGRK